MHFAEIRYFKKGEDSMEKEKNTQWHPAFCSALKLELREDAEHLTYTNEYNINTKPLQMDMLIIKKTKDIEIKNQLGKIFLGHNIIEYISQDDSMNVDVFLKTKGYAYIYKANKGVFERVKEEDEDMCEALRELMAKEMEDYESSVS